MAEVLVVGKKISEMDLVTDIVGDEKIPTGVVGDKAVTTGQLLTYLENNSKIQWGQIEGDIANQADIQNQFVQQLATLQSHIQDQGNPHNVTKDQIGLGLAENTSDMDKPVSTAVQEALSLKADQTYVDDSLTNKTHNSLLGRDADGAHPASAILDESGESQQEINDKGGTYYWRNKNLGYSKDSRVMLANGDVVRSTVEDNITDPNVDMTGWVLDSTSSHNDLSDRNTAGSHPASAIDYDPDLPYPVNTVGRALRDINRDNIVVTGHAEFPEFGMQSGVKINGVPLKRPFDMRHYHFEKPQGFDWDANGHNFWLDKDGVLQSDIDPSDYDVASKSSGVVQYFVSPDGTDTSSNLGTDPSAPLRTVHGAINRINANSVVNAVIWIQPARYSNAYTWGAGITLNSNVSIKPWNLSTTSPYLDTTDTPIIFPTDDTTLTWTLHEGGTYKTTRNGAHCVVDSSIRNKYNDWYFYEKATTLEECNNTAGTWYLEGITLYVHTLDNRQPDANINVFVTKSLGASGSENYSIYLERCWFWGGDFPFYSNVGAGNTTQQVFFNKCKFQYSAQNGLQGRGVSLMICYECEASYNRDDGFNYHSEAAGTTRPPYVIEYKCKAYLNGQTWSPLILSNQGSTTHDASRIVRAGTVCFDNGRQQYADVGDSQSWMIRCQSRVIGEKRFDGAYYADYYCSEGKMWLDHCDASGHDYALASLNGGQLYVRNCNIYPRIFTAHYMYKW